MNDRMPPKFLLRLLKWFCRPEYHIDIEGDLLQLYERRLNAKGKSWANWKLLKDILLLFRPGIIRPVFSFSRRQHLGIFKNYLKVGYRSILDQKVLGFVNLLGLIISFTTVFIIFQYITFESSFDSFHANKDRLYRLEMKSSHEGEPELHSARTYSAAGPDIHAEVSGVENYTRILQGTDVFLSVEGGATGDLISYRMPIVTYVDPSFLSMFTFGEIDPLALSEPNAIVLTKEKAEQFFGEEDPIGKHIVHSRGARDIVSLKVTGVIDDVPANSHLDFAVLISYSTFSAQRKFAAYSWGWDYVYTYLLLRQEADLPAVQAQLQEVMTRHKGEHLKARNISSELSLRPLTDIHLQSNLQFELRPNGSIQSIRFLYMAAFLILAVAILNNVSITNVRHAMRTKEIGIRRVLGAGRKQVFVQLLVESLLVNILCAGIAMYLAVCISPFVAQYLGITLDFSFMLEIRSIVIMLLIICLNAVFSSGDPTFLRSLFTGRSISNVVPSSPNRQIHRYGITLQYGIALILVMITFVVQSQLNYIQNFDLGIDKDYTVVIRASGRPGDWEELHRSNRAFKSEIGQHSWVNVVAGCNSLPGLNRANIGGFRLQGSDPSKGRAVDFVPADEDFVKALGLKIVAGRDFRYHPNDTIQKVLLNERAVVDLGFLSNEEAVGKVVVNAVNRTYQVQGVVADYHSASLKDEISPLMIWNNRYSRYYFLVNLNNGNIGEQISLLEQSWQGIYPFLPFDFFFLDQHLEDQYRIDQQFGGLFTAFSSIAILIACMGIFGLCSFYATRRTKEVGVRKVLGASRLRLVWLLSSDFLVLTSIGILVAMPVAHYLVLEWLQNFVIRVEINEWWYALIGGAVLLIAGITISAQTLKATSVNPVECLKDE